MNKYVWFLGGPGEKMLATSGSGSSSSQLLVNFPKIAVISGGLWADRSGSTKSSKYWAPRVKCQGSLRIAFAVFLNSKAVRPLMGFFGATSNSLESGSNATLA